MKIVFVCTGNTCRSPMAEGYLSSKNLPSLEVSSFGIFADGTPVSHNSAEAMNELGIDISTHITKPLDNGIFSADQIYCMSPSHRDMLLSVGVDSKKLFVLGGGIPDPFGSDIEVYRNCRDCIIEEIDKLIENGTFLPFFIDELKPDYVEQIAELERTCFSEPWSAEAILDSFRSGTVFFVALKDGLVLGYVGIKPVLDEGYITNVAVFPEYRNSGVAKALMNRLDRFAKDRELSFITLEVRESNTPAISLYSRFGYKNEGLRKNFYRSPLENAIIMTKRFVLNEDN